MIPRLNRRQKIRQLFKTLNIELEPTFINLFSPTISQQVLLHYLNEIENKRLPLFDYKSTNTKSLLADLIIGNPELSMRKTIQLFGLKQIFDTINPRELRVMFGKYDQRSWYRLMAEAKTINLPKTQEPLRIIRDHLNNFEPIKLKKFQEKGFY